MPFLRPDYRFHTFDEISAQFLLQIGVRTVLLDIDNTLEPYEHAFPGDRVFFWLNSLTEVGISVAFVSNNGKERVDLFNKDLSLPAYPKAKKPLPATAKRAMLALGGTPANTVCIGDQIFTDVLTARSIGARAILVPPIKDKTDVLTKFKRLLERPILRNMKWEK